MRAPASLIGMKLVDVAMTSTNEMELWRMTPSQQVDLNPATNRF